MSPGNSTSDNSCELCSYGFYSDITSATAPCASWSPPCERGFGTKRGIVVDRDIECVACPSGKYSLGGGYETCKPCAGDCQPGYGKSACKKEFGSCQKCQPGKFSPGGKQYCKTWTVKPSKCGPEQEFVEGSSSLDSACCTTRYAY